MATVTFKNDPTTTVGELPAVGDMLPDFTLVDTELGDVSREDFTGKRLVFNIFPSVDTGVCAHSVRKFNKLGERHDDTAVICVSQDLPFAHARFCGAEGIDRVTSASAFRSRFGKDFGVELEGSPLRGLLARSVIVTDADHRIVYTELVPEIGQEPDYQGAEAALK